MSLVTCNYRATEYWANEIMRFYFFFVFCYIDLAVLTILFWIRKPNIHEETFEVAKPSTWNFLWLKTMVQNWLQLQYVLREKHPYLKFFAFSYIQTEYIFFLFYLFIYLFLLQMLLCNTINLKVTVTRHQIPKVRGNK